MAACACGEPLAVAAKFCTGCGKPVPVIAAAGAGPTSCPKCGLNLTETSSFCSGCGEPLAARSTRGPAAPSVGSGGFRWQWALITIPIVVGVSLSLAFAVGLISGFLGASAEDEATMDLLGVASVFTGMFVGGLVVGWVSPGRTVLEPGVGIAAGVIAMNILANNMAGVVLGWLMPFGIGAAGAALGEWLQGLRQRR